MISILIPIYNGIEYIDESISSVLSQTYDKWELIIAINGHPPNSNVYQTAVKYTQTNKIRVFDFHHLKGKSNTLNEMINHCSYNYVALLDVDDIWHPNKLQIQSQFLNTFDVIGSRCVFFGDKQGFIPNIPVKNICSYNFKLSNPIINSSSIIRKELCFWDKDGVEDYDLWIRLWKQKKLFYNCREILVKHRIHSASAFNSNNHLLVECLLKSHFTFS